MTTTSPTTSARKDPTLLLDGVRKAFPGAAGPVTAVDGIDLAVYPGEIVAFLGPNGAGKTTTLDMVLGLTTPDAGTVSVLGTSPRQAVQAGRVSAVMQTGGLLRDLTVRETVTAIASLHSAKHGIKAKHRIEEVMERTDTSRIGSRRVSKCSGGEQQRLKFALALLPDPDLLILDEPTAGMDVNARREFWDAMRQDAGSGRTVIFATHYLEEAESFARRTVLIGSGKLVADGPTDSIRAMAAGRTVTATLPGDPESAVERLLAYDGVRRVDLNGHRAAVVTTESDALARVLLTEFGASDLEISAPSLESAFVALTTAGSPS